jgi:hypothetical protein
MPRKPLPSFERARRDVETDPRFPSGEWTGFWLQRAYAGRQWMRLFLTFKDGVVSGAGSDRIGDFDMRGTYDLTTGACSIAKTYHGAHAVEYDGKNEGDGQWIWGLWHIRAFDRGGFHLWPAGEDDPTQRRLKASKDVELDRPRVRLVPAEVGAG